MATEIDSLQIEINASATKANDAIDKLVKKLDVLSNSLSKINSSGLSGLASGVDRLGTAMQSMKNIRSNEFTRLANNIERLSKVDVSSLNNTANTISNLTNAFSGIGAISNNSQQLGILSTNLSTLARGIRSFGNINSSNLSSIAATLTPLANGITVLSSVNFNNRNLQNLINSLTRLSNANVSGLSNVNFSQLGNSIGQLATSLQNAPNIHQSIISMTNAISNLSESGQNISVVSANLTGLGNSLRRFMSDMALAPSVSDNTISFSQAIATLANAGNRAGTTATNLPVLASALRNLMVTLSTAPNVSRNVIDLTNALANLASQGGRVCNASNRISSGLNMASASAARAKKSFNGLAGAIGKFYAIYFSVIRVIKGLWKSVESSMDYIETLNYFNKSFEQVAEKADLGSWEQLGYDSAEAYYNSFAERAEELTTKLSGYTVSDTGMLLSTNMPSLGINPSQVMQYQSMFGQMASSMGVTSETALQLSNALTMIGSDLASVRNMDFDKVWTDMASGLAGMSRTLDKYGVNIRNVNLQQKLNELGIQANIQSLNQNEKALLRTIILLDSTRYAWGDLAETINQPANQLRLLKANFENLARTIGNIFLPIVAKVLPYINGFVIALQRLAQFIVNLLGFEGFDWGGVSGSSVDVNELLGLEDATDNLVAANKEAEKLKKTTLGIDELNINAPEESGADSGVGSFSGIDVGLQDALSGIMGEYQSKWDEAFAEMENRANEFADKIEKAFEPVKKLFKDITIGDWFAVGQDVSKIVSGIFNFFTNAINKVDWERIGTNIGEFLSGIDWTEILSSVGEFIWTGINSVIDLWKGSFDAAPIETTILTSIIGISALIRGLSGTIPSLELFASSITSAIGVIGGLSSPILGLVGVLTALTAGLGYVFVKNEEVRNGFFDSVDAIKDNLEPALNLITDEVIPDLSNAWDRLMEILKPFAEFLEGVFTDIWQDMINPALSYIGNTVLPTLITTFENLWSKILVPFATFIGNVFAPIIRLISGLLEMLWKNIIVPLADMIGGVLSSVFEGLAGILNNIIIPVVGFVIDLFNTLWKYVLGPFVDFLVDNFLPIFESVFETIGGLIDGVTKIFTGLIDFVSGVFSLEWGKAWEGVKDVFKGIFNGIASIVEGVINFIIGAINTVLNGLNGVVTSVGDVIGIDITIPTIPKVEIPKFATGGFPKEDGLFMANHTELVGQFTNGKTAVANNEMIVAGIEEAAYKGFSRAYSENNREANLLEELIVAVREGKDIQIDGRSLVQAYDERKARNGYVFG